MSSTDTNQASEDELRTLDEILSQAFTDGASDTMWIADRHVEIFATAKEELLNLIRTEKLKLLNRISSHQEDLFWWTGGEYEKTKAVDMRAIQAERAKLKEVL